MKTRLLIIIGFIMSLSISQAQPSDFMVGLYQLTNGTTSLGPAFGDTNMKEGIVNIAVGNAPNERVFTFQFLPTNNGSSAQVTLDLSSNEFLFPTTTSNLSCGGAPLITYGPAATGNNSTWSIAAGDQSLTVNYTENTLTSCGVAPAQASFILNALPPGQTYVPDDNFEQALINQGYDTTLDDLVTTANIDGLTILDVSASAISDMTGIENFTALNELTVSNNPIFSINLSALSNLDIFTSFNGVTDSVILNPNIEEVTITGSNLTSFDLSAYPNLLKTNLSSNPLTGTLSSGISLQELSVTGTNLNSIDVSNSATLTLLDARNNPSLQSLNLKNNANNLLQSFIATGNPNLICVEVSDVAFMNANFNVALDAGQMYESTCGGSTRTFVPDDNFEQELINLGFDTILDDFIDNANVSNVIALDVTGKSISDLRGVEAFVALDTLRAGSNSIASFDFSRVANARFIRISSNQLTQADLTGNPAVTWLDVDFMPSLQSVDVSANTNLVHLRMQLSQITSIDFSNNPNLEVFFLAGSNNLTSINTSNNPNLLYYDALFCPALSAIDVTQNTALEYLRFGGGFDRTTTNYPINTIDVSNNLNLEQLINAGSRISTVDVSNLTNLELFQWQNSELAAVDLTSNSNLERLFLSDNLMNTLDLSQNPLLNSIGIQRNLITTIDLSAQTALLFLGINENNISSLDLSNNVLLDNLLAQDNDLTMLDLSNNNLLTNLNLQNNQLTDLNINNGANNLLVPNDPADPANQAAWSINVLNNPGLTCIEVSDVPYMNANFTSNIDPTAAFNANCSTASVDDFEVSLKMYPNPAVDQVRITASDSNIENVSIYDMMGRLVKQVELATVSSSYQLNVQELNSGQYLLVIDTNNGRAAETLIKN
ncbi:MAG: T9SS type A sorting domain-containing protein [Nonlabens sp.]|uniref:T9SS type A sorting domain-containing protein n=1 Tax=Nonlabens sp. TaxID=1888209 RepID=UPI003EF8A18F